MNSSPEGALVVTAMDMPQLLHGASPDPAVAAAARAAGFAAGYAEGLRMATRQADQSATELRERDQAEHARRTLATDTATAAVARTAAQLGELSDALVLTMADAVADEVIALAEAVIRAELTEPGHRAAAALRRALSGVADRVSGGHRVSIRLHPDDVAALDPTATAAGVDLVADPGLTPGDGAAVSGDRWVEASIRASLQRIRTGVTV